MHVQFVRVIPCVCMANGDCLTSFYPVWKFLLLSDGQNRMKSKCDHVQFQFKPDALVSSKQNKAKKKILGSFITNISNSFCISFYLCFCQIKLSTLFHTHTHIDSFRKFSSSSNSKKSLIVHFYFVTTPTTISFI